MYLNHLRLIVPLLLVAILSSPVMLAEVSSPADPPKAFLADVDSYVLDSSVHEDRQYQISVALPRTYQESEHSYPVLYALDANSEFGIIAETVRLLAIGKKVPEMVVVGIGYPTGGRYMYSVKYRTLDYTPTVDEKWLAEEKSRNLPELSIPAGTGGAPKFLQFIRKQLIPLIEKQYRVKSDDRILLGHSFGGLFTTYTLFQRNRLFQHFVIGSPSLWWHDRVMFNVEEEYAQTHKSLPARVFISVGSDEDKYKDKDDDEKTVSPFKEFVKVLEKRNYADFKWESHLFEDETHVSVIPATISRGLRSIYAK